MRFLLRLIGFFSVAGGFVALVIDGARAIANSRFVPMSFGEVLAAAFPKSYPGFGPALSGLIGERAFDLIVARLLAAPAFAVGIVLGLILLMAARPPAEPIGHPTLR